MSKKQKSNDRIVMYIDGVYGHCLRNEKGNYTVVGENYSFDDLYEDMLRGLCKSITIVNVGSELPPTHLTLNLLKGEK